MAKFLIGCLHDSTVILWHKTACGAQVSTLHGLNMFVCDTTEACMTMRLAWSHQQKVKQGCTCIDFHSTVISCLSSLQGQSRSRSVNPFQLHFLCNQRLCALQVKHSHRARRTLALRERPILHHPIPPPLPTPLPQAPSRTGRHQGG